MYLALILNTENKARINVRRKQCYFDTMERIEKRKQKLTINLQYLCWEKKKKKR